jgi:dTDP-4-dehydrorhamnose 3,5-epimerase
MTWETTLETYDEIDGLRWVRNVDLQTGPHSSVLSGDKITNLVVRRSGHETEYRVWGIHLTSDDQLTFVSKGDNKPIVLPFVDCRRGSPTAGKFFEITAKPDTSRRLVIPMGVAHRPINTNGLITLNTPVFYWDYRKLNGHRPDEVGIVNIMRDADVDDFPLYDVCRYKVPSWAYPISLAIFKGHFDPTYNTPFVFDRDGKLHVLRKRAGEDS